MKNKSIFFVLMFSTVLCFQNIQIADGQTLNWVRTTGSFYKQGAMVARDLEDNVLSCGYTINDRIYVRKLDKLGNFLWEQESISGIPSNQEQSSWVGVDASNNVLVVGYRYTYSSSSGFQYPNSIVILKYSPTGTLLFKKNIDGVFSVLLNHQCAIDASGNIIIGAAGQVTGQAQAGFIVIKVDGNGSTIFTSTHNFGSVHGVYGMRYRNGYIVVTGTTAISGLNCTTALFDENGNYIWGATTTNYGGQDVELDDAGNAYVINSDFASGLDQDIKVTKYSPTGAVLFSYIFDNNNNSESASRINLQPDGNFVITGIRTSPTTGIETFKLNPAGVEVWNSFYSIPFPDFPQLEYLATNNTSGDVFITGTTSISGNPASLLVIRYDADGLNEWVSKYDSTSIRGKGIAVAGDGNIYVVGSNEWTILKYLNITSGGTCGIPQGVSISAISNYGATVSWTSVSGATEYHVQYKSSSCATFTQVSSSTNSIALNNLLIGTGYDVEVEAICSSGLSGYSVPIKFLTTGKSYCASTSTNPTTEFIDLVWLGAIIDALDNTSGYFDKTNLSADLSAGSLSNSIWLSASLVSSPVYFRVWIDFNRDGDFKDAGEKVVSFKTSSVGWTNKFFNVPSTASIGGTKMRVSLRYSAYATPCLTFDKGQVADYYINLLPAKLEGNFNLDLVDGSKSEVEITLYPNPTTYDLNIVLSEIPEGNLTYYVSDIQGKVLISDNWNSGSF
ncbi:MAG: GEVED domain-containing protein, partial [Chitinophagales bacterium]|nr:GEVED domain-containing protein [Chitinophagales bacterium]